MQLVLFLLVRLLWELGSLYFSSVSPRENYLQETVTTSSFFVSNINSKQVTLVIKILLGFERHGLLYNGLEVVFGWYTAENLQKRIKSQRQLQYVKSTVLSDRCESSSSRT